MKLPKLSPTSLIDGATACFVILIAVAALGLSFANLAALAGVNSFQPWEASLWAGQVDGFIIVATLAVLRAHLTGVRARYAWLLVGVTTCVSVLFNAFHAYAASWLAVIMRGLPPVTLFLSFHLLMGFVREWVTRLGLSKTRAELEGQVTTLSGQLEKLAQEVQTRMDKLDILKMERTDITKAIRDAKKELSEVQGHLAAAREVEHVDVQPGNEAVMHWDTIEVRRGHVLTLTNAGRTPGEIVAKLFPTVSEKTIRRDVLALNGQVEKVHDET